MIRTLFESTKPVEAVARPVNAFRSEMTTGMSAPPIAITICTPRMSATTRMATSSTWLSCPVAEVDAAGENGGEDRGGHGLLPGHRHGVSADASSWSFPNAIIEPAKLTEPTTAENRIETMILASTWPGAPTVSW